MGKAQLSSRGEIYCPIKQMDLEPYGLCFKKDGQCPYYKEVRNGVLECNHPDFENCNPYGEINL